MNTFLQLLIAGLASGSVYGLLALGFLVIHHATGVVNFAQGDMLMVGAVATYVVVGPLGLGYAVAIPVVLFVGVLLALIFNYGLIAPLQRQGAPAFSIMFGTLVFGGVMQEISAFAIGDEQHAVTSVVPNDAIRIGGLSMLPQTLVTIVVAWLMVGVMWWFFRHTLTGLSLRAVGLNRTGAQVTGVRTGRMVLVGFVVSVLVTVVGGLLIAPTVGAGPRMGVDLGVKGFAAAVLGGFNSVYLAMGAGVFLGILESLVAYYVSSTYASAIAYAVLLAALCLEPVRQRLLHRPRAVAA